MAGCCEQCMILLRCRVLWLGILGTFLNLGCFTITLAILMKSIGDLPETYLVNTSQGILQSVIEAGGITLITWASEPTRLGHKWAYLILAFCSAATLIIFWLSGGGPAGAWAYLASKTVFSVVGGGNPQGAPYSVLCAWLAGHLPDELLTAGFSILLGAQFLTMGVVPLFTTGISHYAKLSDMSLVLLGVVVALVQILVVFFLFPSDRQRHTPLNIALNLAEEPAEESEPSHSNPTEEPARSATDRGAFKDISGALRFIMRERVMVTIVWIAINFYAAADSSNIMLYLSSGLKFNKDQVNSVLASLGLYGALITFVIVPVVSRFVPRSAIVFLGVICSIGHSLVYGLATTPAVIIPTGFLGAMSFACIPTLLSYMKATDSADASQGALLGTFYGISSIAKMLGPPILAICLQSFLDDRGMCYIDHVPNFVGAGFVVLAASLLPAVFASLAMVWQEGCRPEKNSLKSAAVSLQTPQEREQCA